MGRLTCKFMQTPPLNVTCENKLTDSVLFGQQTDVSRNRFVILLVCAMFSVFGSNVVKFSGAGALAVLTMATVAAYKWGKDAKVRLFFFR